MIIKDFRQKLYYPADQIVNNLFTNGREFMLLRNFEEYTGFYHRYATGEVFTENEWNPLKSERLIRFREFSESQKKYYDVKLYTKVSPNNPGIRRKNTKNEHEYYRYTAPKPYKRTLTQKEIDAGKTYRYFVTKRNERERVFFEISPEQSIGYADSYNGINQYLYEMVTVSWKVDGPEYDIYENGILKIPGVIDTNLRIIDRYSKKYRLLSQILLNPRELTVYEQVIPQRQSTNLLNDLQFSQPVELGEIPEIYEPPSDDSIIQSESNSDSDRVGGFGFTILDLNK